MERTTIRLTDKQKQYVENLINEGFYQSKTEYFRAKITSEMRGTHQKNAVELQ